MTTPSPEGVLASYSDLPEAVKLHLQVLEEYIGDTDGKDTVLYTDSDTCIDDGTIDASEAVAAFNGIVSALRLVAQPSDDGVRRKSSMAAQWTYDPEAEVYYFAPMQAAPPPYKTQRHVEAIIDIASDGTLAGVELIDNMPPPPIRALSKGTKP